MNCVKIKSIEKINNKSLLYDIEVDKTHCFFANNILVHNSSATFYLRDGEFGVCSRNVELKEYVNDSFWRVARSLDIENKLKQLPYNACLQGELIGEGIQGNPYKIKGQDVRFFNLFNIDTYEFMPIDDLCIFCQDADLLPVPNYNFILPQTIDELLLIAEGKSVVGNVEREGLVIRSEDGKISFKVISNKFLLNKKGE